MPLAFVLSIVGCRPAQKYDRIENELRVKDRELAEARNELAHTRQLNDAYQHAAPGGDCKAPAGGGGLVIRDVILGSGTGGVDDDGHPGDESFQVVVVPRDLDATPIKVPARLQVRAYEVGRDGIKTPIGSWDITPDQLRKTWRAGLFSTGYSVPLAWDKPPATDRVRIAVRLVTLDGKPFEVDKDISVRPLLSGRLLPPGEACPAPIPRGEELPPPTILEGGLPRPAIFGPPQEFK